ncbi:MAG: hypothetical protein WAW88_15410 [Nocardioides sp.]
MSVPPLRVLYLCTANVSRSPFLEAYTRAVAGGAVAATSAGTHAQPGAAIDPAMVPELMRRDLDVPDGGSRLFEPALCDQADLVLTASAQHRNFVLDDRPTAVRKVYTVGQFAATLERWSAIGGASGSLRLGDLAGYRAADSEAHNLADPYGLGAAVAAASAERMTGLLDRIIPVLVGARADS